MAITFEQIKAANEAIKTLTMTRTDKKTGEVKKNEYAEVHQRIKAFRMVYPEGFILSEMVSNEGEPGKKICIFKTTVGYYDEKGEPKCIGSGMAYEKENATFINQTSYLEVSETSAVGRALGMAGFGIDYGVASAEEVQQAIANQGDKVEAKEEAKAEQKKATPKQIEVLMKVYTGANLEKLLSVNGIERIEDLPMTKASDLIAKLAKKEEQQNG